MYVKSCSFFFLKRLSFSYPQFDGLTWLTWPPPHILRQIGATWHVSDVRTTYTRLNMETLAPS